MEEEEEKSDLFVFNDTIEGPRAPITKLIAWGGRIVENMCYERRRAEASVD